MFNLNKHRNDFVKTIYDLLKIWLTISMLTPFATKDITVLDFIIGLGGALSLLLTGIILRQGGEVK